VAAAEPIDTVSTQAFMSRDEKLVALFKSASLKRVDSSRRPLSQPLYDLTSPDSPIVRPVGRSHSIGPAAMNRTNSLGMHRTGSKRMQRTDSTKSTASGIHHVGSLYQGNACHDDDKDDNNIASKLFMGMGLHRIEEFRQRLAEEQEDREGKRIGHAVFGAGCE
jgi:hypothetical protein